MGPSSRNVRLGEGAGNLGAFFDELERRNLRPLAMTLDTSGIVVGAGGSVRRGRRVREGRAAGLRPALQRVLEDSSDPLGRRHAGQGRDADRGGNRATDGPRRGRSIEAALPRQAFAKPQKARTLLVIESLHGMSHNTIPHTNVMLERFGATTGAWTDGVQQRPHQSAARQDRRLRRHLPQQHRRRAVRRSGGARQRGQRSSRRAADWSASTARRGRHATGTSSPR